jgi:hypothetical protein
MFSSKLNFQNEISKNLSSVSFKEIQDSLSVCGGKKKKKTKLIQGFLTSRNSQMHCFSISVMYQFWGG